MTIAAEHFEDVLASHLYALSVVDDDKDISITSFTLTVNTETGKPEYMLVWKETKRKLDNEG